MDPITLWIFILATGWVIRSLIEDGAAAVAAARGHPYVSPRIVRREARQRLALERIAAGGSPPLTIVFSERLADRIANPPERRWLRDLREYLDLVIADGFEDAKVRHEERRAEKRGEQPAANPRRPAPTTEQNDDIVDAEIVEPEPDVDDHETGLWQMPCPVCGGPAEEAGTTCPSCSTTSPQPTDPAPPSPPPALPAPDSTRKDSSVTNTINGDVGSPAEALAFCEHTLDLNTACCNEIDVALANLRGVGCGQQFLDIITGGLTAADVFDNAVSGARVRYARHVLTHADLTSDPDLRNTLQGYLSADKV